MNWFVQMRRFIAAITLAMLVLPAAVMAAGSLIDSEGHEHMHSSDHGSSLNEASATGDKAAHDKLLCSIVVPCEHGFCAGLGIFQLEQDAEVPKSGWSGRHAGSVYPACPECRSPPPKSFS
ncbi:MAG: hypothetical protein ACMVY4_07190 [Minwuia sp.]|uniref:hypothetical protein n=1 Tax=Minwuia sp. TaxID=2493630 RepID=UPI003A8460C8